MQRTYNYTGRRKIESNEVQFSFSDENKKLSFDVKFNFDVGHYPGDAVIYVEAYSKETRQRYSFGKISSISPPSNREISQVDLSGNVLFRILIVDESGSHGMLLASGDRFSAHTDQDKNKSSILTIVQRSLGELPWRVDIGSGSHGEPELIINKLIPNGIEKLRSNSLFQALILPAALKQILTHYIWNQDAEDQDMFEKWMGFAELYADERPQGEDPTEISDWIDEVVSKHSHDHKLCQRLMASYGEL